MHLQVESGAFCRLLSVRIFDISAAPPAYPDLKAAAQVFGVPIQVLLHLCKLDALQQPVHALA